MLLAILLKYTRCRDVFWYIST